MSDDDRNYGVLTDSSKFWLVLWGMVGIGVVIFTVVIAITTVNSNQIEANRFNTAFSAALAKGADPIAARCGINGWSGTNADTVCTLAAAGRRDAAFAAQNAVGK